MNRSKLINHINHLNEEVKELNVQREVLLEKKSLAAIFIYDTSIKLLERRIKECEAELEEDRHEEE
tara:strand:- start:334 stop:531 length:198 start_codon:yes stop_codon:yes gene_type:complete